MGHADLREIYLPPLEQAARIAATDDFLAFEIERLTALIFDAARADTKKQFTNDRFDEAIQFMREFAAQRPQHALNEVARIRERRRLGIRL